MISSDTERGRRYRGRRAFVDIPRPTSTASEADQRPPSDVPVASVGAAATVLGEIESDETIISGQLFMDTSFPLASHPHAAAIREAVRRSLYGENADPNVDEWSDDAAVYTRSDSRKVTEYLEERGIMLTLEEQSALMDFALEYASIVDGEEDDAADRERAASEARR